MNNPASQAGNSRRVQIDSDWLGEMVRLVKEGKINIDGIFDFLARYVGKVHSDEFIHKGLRLTPGKSFLDVIGPNDIAYVIALVKNCREMWDQDIRLASVRVREDGQPSREKIETITHKWRRTKANARKESVE